MPALSRNQRLFAALATVLTITFFVFLHRLLDGAAHGSIPVLAAAYGVAMFLAGLVLGATDPVAGSRSDLGFGYHLITFVVVALAGSIATLLHGDGLGAPLLGLALWAFGLGVHYLGSRRTLKGIARDQAFP